MDEGRITLYLRASATVMNMRPRRIWRPLLLARQGQRSGSRMNISLRDIRYARFNSKSLRCLLSLAYKEGRPYTIRFGPLRGLKMFYSKSVNYHAILGLWDTETFRILHHVFAKSRLLPQDGVVADVGGNIGYYTLWFAKLGVRMGHVYSFEPAPEPLRLLKENVRLNKAANVEIIACACGDHVGDVEFFIASHHHCSSLNAEWAGADASPRSVPMTTLDIFFAGRRAPDFIKIDIEGGGVFALPGCRRILGENRPFVLIESHTPVEDDAISKVLVDLDYRGYRMTNREWVGKPHMTYPDREGVWGTLLLVPRELEEQTSSRLASAP
jgi:FkbM family methyltransferase